MRISTTTMLLVMLTKKATLISTTTMLLLMLTKRAMCRPTLRPIQDPETFTTCISHQPCVRSGEIRFLL